MSSECMHSSPSRTWRKMVAVFLLVFPLIKTTIAIECKCLVLWSEKKKKREVRVVHRHTIRRKKKVIPKLLTRTDVVHFCIKYFQQHFHHFSSMTRHISLEWQKAMSDIASHFHFWPVFSLMVCSLPLLMNYVMILCHTLPHHQCFL